MKCIVKRPDYSYNYAFDGNGGILGYIQGNIINSWSVSFRENIRRIQFSKKENLQIGDYAFYDCGYIGDLVIPDNVSSIGREAFSICNEIDNVFFNLDSSGLGFNTLFNGPTGKLYVTEAHVNSFAGGVGNFYDGMEVALWSTYPNLP